MATIKKVETGKHSGKWRLRAGAGGKVDKIFPTKGDAQKWLNRNGAKASDKRKSEWTLEQTFDWLKDTVWPQKLEKSTIGTRLCRYNLHVHNDWGGYLLSDIDPVEFQEWILKVKASGVGDPTVQKIKSDLVTLWNEAVRYGRAPRTYANPFMVEISGGPVRVATVLSPNVVVKAVLKATDAKRTLLALGFYAGLRIGEIQALTWSQIRESFILVDRAVKARPEVVGLPKKNRVRQVVLCEHLRVVLDNHDRVGEHVLRQLRFDKHLTKKQVYTLWKDAVSESGLPAGIKTHDMRLNHINWLEKLAPEVSDTTLREHVGHATSGVTQTNYTRPLTDSQRSLANSLDRILRDAAGEA